MISIQGYGFVVCRIGTLWNELGQSWRWKSGIINPLMATAHVIRNVLYFADTKSISTPKK
jgi:hypothetical protein